MIKRSLCLNQLIYCMVNGQAWFHLHGFRWPVRGVSEKFKMKIYVSSGIRTHALPFHDRKVSALDRSATLVKYQVEYLLSDSILIYEYKWKCDNTCIESVMVWYRIQSSVNS